MNDNENQNDAFRPSDEQILDGVRRRLAGVEPLVPAPDVWQSGRIDRRAQVTPSRLNVHVRPAGALGFGGVLAVALATVVIAMSLAHQGPFYGGPSGPGDSPSLTAIVYELQPVNGAQPTAADVATTVRILESRAVAIGADVSVTAEPPNRVVLDVRGTNPELVATSLTPTGHFVLVPLPRETYGSVDTTTGASSTGDKVLPVVGETIDPSLPVQFSGGDLDRGQVSARYEAGLSEWAVDFAFQGALGTAFAAWSGQHVGDYFAIVLDGKVLEVPFIQSALTTGQATIGYFPTAEAAKSLAALLKSGELPFPLHEIVGPAPTSTGQVEASPAAIVAPSAPTPSDIPTNGRTLGDLNAPVTMDVWIDFRCSACSDFATGTQRQLIAKYVMGGRVKIVYHDLIVIDLRDKTHASEDAANAAQCAADQGKYWVYTDWLWANRDPQEAAGAVSRDRLIEMTRRAGLDVAAFQACYDAGTHRAGVRAESASASAPLIEGTPTILVNGQVVGENGIVPDSATVSAAIDLALAAAPSASASN